MTKAKARDLAGHEGGKGGRSGRGRGQLAANNAGAGSIARRATSGPTGPVICEICGALPMAKRWGKEVDGVATGPACFPHWMVFLHGYQKDMEWPECRQTERAVGKCGNHQ